MQNVLIIDDNPMLRSTLKEILEFNDFAVAIAADGNQAMEEFQKNQPDLIIVDILMPEKDGIETIIALKKLEPSVKIIAMSGGGNAGFASFLHMAKLLGANDTIEKPFTTQRLLEIINGVLS